jgi:outer membrane lipoprotein SlyB
VEGRIVSKRQVIVQGTGALGGTAGAVLGGVGGSAIGGSARANVAGAVAGAVAGGIAGAVIEESATRQQAFEYIVKSDVAGLMTIIQADNNLNVDDSVYVVLSAKPVIVKAGAR